jgi:hypothetical protein
MNPDPHQRDADPQHWLLVNKFSSQSYVISQIKHGEPGHNSKVPVPTLWIAVSTPVLTAGFVKHNSENTFYLYAQRETRDLNFIKHSAHSHPLIARVPIM